MRETIKPAVLIGAAIAAGLAAGIGNQVAKRVIRHCFEGRDDALGDSREDADAGIEADFLTGTARSEDGHAVSAADDRRNPGRR